MDPAAPQTILDYMLGRSLIVEDSSIVAIGPTGEQEYGRRNFMDVTSLFLTEPLLAVPMGSAPPRVRRPVVPGRPRRHPCNDSCSADAHGAFATLTGTAASSG